MGPDGRILSQGSLSNALAKDETLLTEGATDGRAIEQADGKIDESGQDAKVVKKSAGKLVMSEEVSEGHVGWTACTFVCLL